MKIFILREVAFTYLLVVGLIACEEVSEPIGEARRVSTQQLLRNKMYHRLTSARKPAPAPVAELVQTSPDPTAFSEVDKEQILQSLLDDTEFASSTWEKFTAAANGYGTLRNILDDYVHRLIVGDSSNTYEGIKRATELGADWRKAMEIALSEKNQEAVAALIGLGDNQQQLDQVRQRTYYGTMATLLIRAWQKGDIKRRDAILEDIGKSYVNQVMATQKALVAKDYEARGYALSTDSSHHANWPTLSLTTNPLDTKGREVLIKIFQTQNDYVVDELLEGLHIPEGMFLDRLLLDLTGENRTVRPHQERYIKFREELQLDWLTDYRTVEYVVDKGGDAHIALHAYLKLFTQRTHRLGDKIQISTDILWPLVRRGADPNKLAFGLYDSDLYGMAINYIGKIIRLYPYERVSEEDRLLLEFLFAHLPQSQHSDKKKKKLVDKSRELIRVLVTEKKQQADLIKRYDEKFESEAEGLYRRHPAEDENYGQLRDDVIALLKKQKA